MIIYKMETPFDLMNNIFDKSGFIDDPMIYSKFIFPVLKFLSYVEDFIYLIDELNMAHYSNEHIYEILYHMIPKRRRRINFPKKLQIPTDIKAIMQFYGVDSDKASIIKTSIGEGALERILENYES